MSSELTIGFTPAAAFKAKTLIDEEGNFELNLRVFVTGGGCSGFEYGFTFDEDIEDDDTQVVEQGVRLVIDPLSYQYLAGAEVDFKEDLQGSRFVCHQPERQHHVRLWQFILNSLELDLEVLNEHQGSFIGIFKGS